MAKRLFFLLLTLSSMTVFGSAVEPRSFREEVSPLERVERFEVERPDVGALIAEDHDNEGKGVPFRAASSIKTGISPESCGSVDHLSDGSALWRLRIYSQGAVFLSFIFDDFMPEEGIELYVYSPSGDHIIGPFGWRDVNPDGLLGTPVVPGEESVVEICFPSGVVKTGMTLGEVFYGYRNFQELSASGACEVDINCPAGSSWQNEKRAVAHIYFSGYICTGTLLNDVPGDRRNYFLTANHCISKSQKASVCVFYWNYENPSCGAGSGSLTQNQTGSALRATDSNSDFTLLELNAVPDPAFNVYYAGWTNSLAAPAGGTCIHHPNGDVKKISVEYDALVDGSLKGANFWRAPSWDVGATEGGSSGSGLWDQNHRIVGQLYGGDSVCGGPPVNMWDEYGKFCVSWAAGSTADTRLKDWLDPGNTGAVYVNGEDTITSPVQEVIETVNAPAGFSWSASDASNYRVLRGLREDLANLDNGLSDFSCYSFGSATSVDISGAGDDPSIVPGRCYYYLVQGYNWTDPDFHLGPAGNSTAGERQVDTPAYCD